MRKVSLRAMHASVLRQICLYLLFAFCLPLASEAKFLPPHTVTGQITDDKKAPLPGVSVLLKGTKRGVTTDAEGKFTMADVPDNGVLVISYSGFATQEVKVDGRESISISLEQSVSKLDEVVVIGYGTR